MRDYRPTALAAGGAGRIMSKPVLHFANYRVLQNRVTHEPPHPVPPSGTALSPKGARV
jgi:hypothetical protein